MWDTTVKSRKRVVHWWYGSLPSKEWKTLCGLRGLIRTNQWTGNPIPQPWFEFVPIHYCKKCLNLYITKLGVGTPSTGRIWLGRPEGG